jgi:hypothetical protein
MIDCNSNDVSELSDWLESFLSKAAFSRTRALISSALECLLLLSLSGFYNSKFTIIQKGLDRIAKTGQDHPNPREININKPHYLGTVNF